MVENEKAKAEEFYQKALSRYQRDYLDEALDLVNKALYHNSDYTEAKELKLKLEEEISYSKTTSLDEKTSFDRKTTKKEIRKTLFYSLAAVGGSLIVILICLNPNIPLPFSSRILMINLFIVYLIIGIVSFIIYFINPEIAYVLWIGKRRRVQINNKNVKTGRLINLIIMFAGVMTTLIVFTITILTFL
ncbi:MAG: hypothetical protein ACFFE4_22095 [Candidatus Thorarchaeota archaeon]